MTDPTAQPAAVAAADYAAQRVSYDRPGLARDDLAPTPLAQFEQWYAEAAAAGIAEPNAMVLSTVDAAGAPTGRTVLLKAADPRGFVLYTNYTSRKATQIAAQPRVSLLFGWHAMARQVVVRGLAERVPAAETAAYFASRPWGSRIGAWASHQSREVADPGVLQQRWDDLAQRWPDRGRSDDVPVPEHWGGFLVRAVEVEFWQGRPSRLHDRLVYLADGLDLDAPFGPEHPRPLDDAGAWRVVRREP